MLVVLGHLFDHLTAQAPTTEAYDSFNIQLNTGLQKVFENFEGLNESLQLAPVRRFTDARGGEGPSEIWKPASKFTLRDEIDYDQEDMKILSISPSKHNEEDSGEDFVIMVVLGLETSKKMSQRL